MANSTAPAAQAQARPKAKTILLIEDEEAHVEPLDDIMLLIDTNFTIERVNKAAEELIGKEQRGSNREECYQSIHGQALPTASVWCLGTRERREK